MLLLVFVSLVGMFALAWDLLLGLGYPQDNTSLRSYVQEIRRVKISYAGLIKTGILSPLWIELIRMNFGNVHLHK